MAEGTDADIRSAVIANLNAIIGTSVFVLLGITSGFAGPAMVISFLVAGLIAYLTALSSAELSSFIGGREEDYINIDQTSARFFGFLIGWIQSFSFVLGASVGSVGFAAYLVYGMDIDLSWPYILLIGGGWPLVLTIANIARPPRKFSPARLVLAFKLGALMIFITVGGAYLLSQGDFSNYIPFAPRGLEGILGGASMNFYAYAGFSAILIFSQRFFRPSEIIPKALAISNAVATLLYISVALVAIGLVNWRILRFTSAPLEMAFEVATDSFILLLLIGVTALIATSTVIQSSLSQGTQVLSAMAREGMIPGVFGRGRHHGIPLYSLIPMGAFVSLLVILSGGNLLLLASMFNFATLVSYLLINLVVIYLRRLRPDSRRVFKVPFFPWLPGAGILGCFIIMVLLNRSAIAAVSVWILLGILAYGLNTSRKTRQLI